METIPILHRAKNREGKKLVQMILLFCGIFSSLLYVAINIFIPMQYPGYNATSQTVSELSAIGTPTRTIWVILCSFYTLLVVAFGWGVWKSGARKPSLRTTGALLIIYGTIGLAWPPMHQRAVLAASGGTLTDTMHIVFTFITVLLMLGAMGFSTASLGKRFRIYSIATILVLFVFGALTGMAAPQLEANLPTPWIGVWERISIGAYLVWVVVLAITLLRAEKVSGSIKMNTDNLL